MPFRRRAKAVVVGSVALGLLFLLTFKWKYPVNGIGFLSLIPLMWGVMYSRPALFWAGFVGLYSIAFGIPAVSLGGAAVAVVLVVLDARRGSVMTETEILAQIYYNIHCAEGNVDLYSGFMGTNKRSLQENLAYARERLYSRNPSAKAVSIGTLATDLTTLLDAIASGGEVEPVVIENLANVRDALRYIPPSRTVNIGAVLSRDLNALLLESNKLEGAQPLPGFIARMVDEYRMRKLARKNQKPATEGEAARAAKMASGEGSALRT